VNTQAEDVPGIMSVCPHGHTAKVRHYYDQDRRLHCYFVTSRRFLGLFQCCSGTAEYAEHKHQHSWAVLRAQMAWNRQYAPELFTDEHRAFMAWLDKTDSV